MNLHIWRWLISGACLVATAGPMIGGAPVAAAAGLQNVHAWVTVASTEPGIGCTVAVSVEARAGGESLPGLLVEIALFGDGVNPSSLDQAMTGDDGIAVLSFYSGDATDGASSWLDINLAGVFIGGTEILPASDGDCSGGGRVISTEVALSIDSARSVDADQVTGVRIDGIPAYQQERSLSCEYASIQIATSAFGNPIPEGDYLASTPQSDNPHFGFRGDIDGPWGITDDYGIYAEALVPNLEAHGYTGDVSYGADRGYLQSQIDAGHPTLVWIATRGDTGFYETDAEGNSFKLVPYEHVVVVYGYDDTGVYISDPGNASYQHMSWNWFLDAWSVMDGMALSIYPA